ncbi:MAG: type I restriction enzyme HsdR N-terminal domain-containing protein [Synechococcus sp. SB0676_bin_10]|uniref:Type I restriction enzyme HsdR N-terminal domain-containing protein n=1 Tax=Synechococcus sp. SB0676_bin_10 TaxID=2604869 RepID=A0A6B1FCK5_9SYNE|nr:type I restriction enzyme HsdR N-terminal domain-containing protein [Synechococcus sp. SB0676_bin_10]
MMCHMHGQGELSDEQETRIRRRAEQFVQRWQNRHDLTESRESQTFINEFFGIFDIDRFASNIRFEYNIYQNQQRRRIDVFWPDVILIENKSPGEKLDRALEQVRTYLHMLRRDKFRYVLINNFRWFIIYRVQRENQEITMSRCASFPIEDLPNQVHRFYYFLDYKHSETIKEIIEKPVEKVIEKPIEIEKIIKEIVYKTRYGILILASSLSLAFGYIISDGQPREYLERFIEVSTREESTR